MRFLTRKIYMWKKIIKRKTLLMVVQQQMAQRADITFETIFINLEIPMNESAEMTISAGLTLVLMKRKEGNTTSPADIKAGVEAIRRAILIESRHHCAGQCKKRAYNYQTKKMHWEGFYSLI